LLTDKSSNDDNETTIKLKSKKSKKNKLKNNTKEPIVVADSVTKQTNVKIIEEIEVISTEKTISDNYTKNSGNYKYRYFLNQQISNIFI